MHYLLRNIIQSNSHQSDKVWCKSRCKSLCSLKTALLQHCFEALCSLKTALLQHCFEAVGMVSIPKFVV